MDVVEELTELRDKVRASIEHFEAKELPPDQAEVLSKRKKVLREIEALINRVRGLH